MTLIDSLTFGFTYKSSKLVLTRFGPVSKATAYKKYRKGCGRDARLKELWGDKAFVADH